MRFDNIQDIIEMQDLDLEDEEVQHIAYKIFNPKVSGLKNLHYPGLEQWINQLSTKFEQVENDEQSSSRNINNSS